MATSYGFFNSISGDRLYNADDVNTFLEGLVGDGLYANVDDMFAVTPGSGMSVNVAAGKASLLHHWFRSDAVETLSIGASHAVLNRYDVIVIRMDKSDRSIALGVITGTPASSPQVPSIRRDDDYYDLALAYISVPAGASSIGQSLITDVRLNSAVCGIVTGIIDQLDTSTFAAQLQAWMEAQTTAFNNWFATLTEEMEVNAYISAYSKTVEFTYPTDAIPRTINLDMAGYIPNPGSIVLVSVDGFTLPNDPGYYSLNADHSVLFLTDRGNPANNTKHTISIRVLQSQIGDMPDLNYNTMTRGRSNAGIDVQVGTTVEITTN